MQMLLKSQKNNEENQATRMMCQAMIVLENYSGYILKNPDAIIEEFQVNRLLLKLVH